MRLERAGTALPCSLTALCAIVLLFVSACHAMGVVGIDYGTESMKISLVKPGEPFDVVLSRDSKRKIPAAVAWKVQERLYGSDAANLASRYPGDTFIGAKFLLGREFSDEAAKARFAGLLDARLIPNPERNDSTISIQRETDYTINKEGADIYSIEEIVGTQFGHAKTLAEEQAGEEVVRKYPGSIGTFGGLDVAITVPIFYTAAERQAIFDAAQIAGIKPRLVSDGTAVAVNYAMTRTFAKPEKHMFFDAGAGSTSATIVEFSTKTVQADSILSIGATQKEAIVVDVIGAGWDREANGMALDLLVREELARQFEKKHAKQITKPLSQQPRAMARLLKEANRVKHILSANLEATSYVEMLADEIDFRGSISRETFEKLAQKAGLSSRFGQAARDALQNAGLSLKDIDSVVLVGGATRIPLVQASLRDAGVSDGKIAQNVNADEAAVMGAAFYGASFNPQFRMKSIKANDGTPFPIVIKEPDGTVGTLFASKGLDKVSSVRSYPDVTDDFVLHIAYDQSVSSAGLDGQKHELYNVQVNDVHRHLAELKTEGQLNNVEVSVNVSLITEPLGTIRAERSYLHVKQKPGGLVGALKGFFNVGLGSSSSDDDVAEDVATDDATNSTNADGANSTAAAKKEKKKEEVPSERQIAIDAKIVSIGSLHTMSAAELKSASDRLYVANVQERKKAAREEARNVLESYLYRMRDTVEEAYFKKASKSAERSVIKSKLEELSDWLSGDGDTADTSSLKVKRASLESLVKPIEKRITEQRVRGKAVRTFEKASTQAQTFITEARANLTEAMAANLASKFTVAEIDSFEEQLKKDKKWYEEKSKAQAKRSLDEDVVLPSEEVEKRAKKLIDTIKRYQKRRVPKARPPKKEAPKKEEQVPVTADVETEIPVEPEQQGESPPPPKENEHIRHEEL